MEALLIFVVVILLLYATGKLSTKNEARVKAAIQRLKGLFGDESKSK